jgi:predicted DNA-binding protein
MPSWHELVNDFMPRGSKVATKKNQATSAHDLDRIIVRLPEGMRERIAERAATNGRSMTAEVVEAIEKHLEGADRMTRVWEFIEKHRENVEALDRVWDAVEDLEHRVEKIDGDGSGVLTEWRYKKEDEARLKKNPPA